MSQPLIWLGILALPTACVAWVVTREEIFREPREWLVKCSQTADRWWQRKLCYVFTCDFCFSHYVAAVVVAVTDFQLLLPDWRGYVIAWFALVAIANVYLSAYSRLRVEIHKEKVILKEAESRTMLAG